MLKRVPTRQKFEQMAARGRLHKQDNTVIPTDSELDEAQSPVDLGRRTATLKMVLHTFISSGGACRKAAYIEYVRDLQQAKIPPR
jgi:hypothetical protein